DEDEFYYVDLIGRAVEDENGKAIGSVIALENFGASDLLEIKPKIGASFYLPFTDECVLEITDDKIIVRIPEGLIE
ncbi:MAG: PRC-barrel domain-containing protein, partial [Pseudomonadota bacterium]